MVFRKQVIEERLAFLQETVKELRRHQPVLREDFLKDKVLQWAVEHGLHLLAEAIFDIGNHILVGHFAARAVNYEKVLPALQERGVVSDKMVGHFQKLGGFRNILVHEYLDVDTEKVYERLQYGLDDFDQFRREIVAWLKNLG